MIRAIRRAFSIPNKIAVAQLALGLRSLISMNTAQALRRCGVLGALDRPRSLDELADQLEIKERAMLRHLLDHAVRCRLLRRKGELYTMRRSLARVLGSAHGKPVAAMLDEVLTYHNEVFRALPGRLRGEPAVDYLERYASTVAESSRIIEPLILAFMRDELGTTEGKRVLEIGCGAGAYLEYYASLHGEHGGIGVDLDRRVVDLATETIARAHLSDRFEIRHADARSDDAFADGPFDVITAHQNAYYFDAEGRRALWNRCFRALAPGGRVVITTATSGGPMSDYFDLILRSSRGCTFLPSIDEIMDELAEAGFDSLRKERMLPGDEFWGIVAQKRMPETNMTATPSRS